MNEMYRSVKYSRSPKVRVKKWMSLTFYTGSNSSIHAVLLVVCSLFSGQVYWFRLCKYFHFSTPSSYMFLFLTTYSSFYLKFFVGTVGSLITHNLLGLEVWLENDLVVETNFLWKQQFQQPVMKLLGSTKPNTLVYL